MDPVQEFLDYVLKALVDKPELVKVDRKVDEMGVLLTVDVGQDDMGKIIGRSGATAKALRIILRTSIACFTQSTVSDNIFQKV